MQEKTPDNHLEDSSYATGAGTEPPSATSHHGVGATKQPDILFLYLVDVVEGLTVVWGIQWQGRRTREESNRVRGQSDVAEAHLYLNGFSAYLKGYVDTGRREASRGPRWESARMSEQR